MLPTLSKVTSPHQKNNLCKRVTDSEVDIKFPHQVMKKLNWPLRSNIDIAHKRRVFYDSKELKGTGPFSVPSLSYIESKAFLISLKRKYFQINNQTNCRLQ